MKCCTATAGNARYGKSRSALGAGARRTLKMVVVIDRRGVIDGIRLSGKVVVDIASGFVLRS